MFLTQKAFMVAKLEATPYTPETLADADYDIEVENLSWSENIVEFQRKVADGTLDSYNSVMGKQDGTVTFTVPINPGAAVATEPTWSKFLQACGYKATGWDAGAEVAVGSAVEGISWYLHSDYTHIPITIECAELNSGSSPGQLITLLAGCMGNVEFMIGDTGEPIQMNFEFKGSLESITDRTFANKLDPTAVPTVQPPAVLGATVTVGGVTQCIAKFSINTGNSVNLWTCATEATGIRGAYIGSRETILTLDPIAELLATDPVYTQWLAGTTGAVVISLASTPALAFSAPVAQYSAKARGERDEGVTAEKTFRLHKSGAGNNVLELLQGAKS